MGGGHDKDVKAHGIKYISIFFLLVAGIEIKKVKVKVTFI